MRNQQKRWLALSLLLFLPMILFYFLPKPPPLLETLSFSQVITDNQGNILTVTLSADEKYRIATPLSSINPAFIQATLLKEDAYFYHHPGVNPIALTRAFLYTYILHRRRQGASTLTMQVARLRFHLQTKTIPDKGLQIYRALQLERYYDKNEILEAYVNLAPFGRHIEGIGAASFLYFNKCPSQLNLPEILLLANLPQNPNRLLHSSHLYTLRNRLLHQWLSLHTEDNNMASLLTLTPTLRTLKNKPFLAPHFVTQILANQQTKKWHTIHTTLDLSLQRLLEKVTQDYLTKKQYLGAQNAALLLIDTRDMTIQAMIGSSDL